MAQSSLDVQQLVGQARNPVHGGGDVRPWRIFNLVPDRMGGYVPYGYRSRLLDAGGGPITLEHINSLIGFDETGISSFDASGSLRLFRGRTTFNPQAPMPAIDDEALVHLDGSGAYIDRDNYFVLDRERRPMQPINANFTATNDAGGTTSIGVIGSSGGQIFSDSSDATIMAWAGASVYRSQDGGDTWEMIYTPDLTGLGVPRGVAYGQGRWFVYLDYGAYYSDNNGGSWSFVDIRGPSGYTSGGDMIYSMIFGTGVWVAFGTRIWSSADGGDTWAAADSLLGPSGNYFEVHAGTYIANADEFILPTYFRQPSRENPTHMLGTRSDSGGSFPTPGIGANSWDTVIGLATPWGSFAPGVQSWGVPHEGVISAANGQDKVIYAYADGRVYGTVDGAVEKLTLPGPDRDRWVNMQFRSYATLADTVVTQIRYNHINDHWVIVGYSPTMPAQPRVWHSANGKSWSRVEKVEEAIVAYAVDDFTDPIIRIWSVAFASSGDEVYMVGFTSPTRSVAFRSGLTTGLTAGTYNLWAVAYFNTPSGRLVFHMSKHQVSLSDDYGGRIVMSADTKATILANNPWISAVDASIVDDLRYDVYIQREAPIIEGERAETTIRYAYTEPFSDDTGGVMASSGRDITVLPLGRQLIVGGAATTAVFEKRRTAIHNGRVWGLMNQEEDSWRVEQDGISPEIANQFNRFVLGYSEVGWANLMSDRSFIPIQPTQSQNFTGIVSTPSGLLVMFDNEIFLVTGDPAFGNVSVELYLDMAGCDGPTPEDSFGTRPCKVGGIPFSIWNGKVWALQAGQASSIAPDQWLAEDPFVRIAPEPQSRSLLALTKGGSVFRYILDDQFWLTDPVSRDHQPISEMLPNCNCESGDNTRFVEDDGVVWSSRRDGAPNTPHIVFRDIDFSTPDQRNALYVVKATFEGEVVQQQYDRSAGDFDASAVPRLLFGANHSTNGDTWETVDPQPGGILPVVGGRGNREVAALSWRLPLGATKGYSIDVRLELNGMQRHDVLKMPLRMFFSSAGALR